MANAYALHGASTPVHITLVSRSSEIEYIHATVPRFLTSEAHRDDTKTKHARVLAGTSATYVYHGLHRQIQKTVNSTSTRFYYAGWQRIADYNGSTLLTRYVYGDGGTLTYLHHDRIGSVIATTNSGGSVTNTHKFSPFGEGSLSGTTSDLPASALIVKADYVITSAVIIPQRWGAFCSPIHLAWIAGCGCGGTCGDEGSPDELKLNLYAYVANDPLNKTDSTGLAADGHWLD